MDWHVHTVLKRFSGLHFVIPILLFMSYVYSSRVDAQPCTSNTPSYTVDLTGSPDSTWTSLGVVRDGDCCGSTAPDRCIEFFLTLDTNTSGIRLDIISGALPGGALFYQIGCGTSYQVGDDICLTGAGPHRITFCKPGNNINVYQIKAIPKPGVRGKLIINQACIGFLQVAGLVDTSITWQSVPNNATHNSYLSCLEDCDSVSIIPTGAYPPTVTYRVCGLVKGGCGGTTFCDTATVRFVTNIDVDVQPKNATVCFGGTTASLTANAVGGLAPFRFTWNTGDTTPTIAVGAGTYHVTMLDSLGCIVVRDTVVVTSFSMPILAQAGNDTTICTKQKFALLRGSVQAASGGVWKGGTGTFSPSDTSLNATYVPSAAETLAGVANLMLITTGNGTCPPDTDHVQILVKPTPAATVNGPAAACVYRFGTYTTQRDTSASRSWLVTKGTIIGSASDTFVLVRWDSAGTGTVRVTHVNAFGCDSSIAMSVQVNPTPIPVVSGPDSVCAHGTTTYFTNFTAGHSYQWTVSGGTISGSSTDTLVRIAWGVNGTGSVTLQQTNGFGCDSTIVRNVRIDPTPAPLITGPDTVCAFSAASYHTNPQPGYTYQWLVSGATITGSATDSVLNVRWGVSGNRNVTLKQINSFGCDSTLVMNVRVDSVPVPVINGPDSVCERQATIFRTAAVAATTHLWSVSGGTIIGSSTDTSVMVLWSAAGAGSITLKQTNSLGCDSTVSKNIRIDPTPVPFISGPDSVCAFRSSVFRTTGSPGYSYAWTVTGGTISGSATDTIMQVTWSGPGSGSVSILITNAFNCDSSVTKNIRIDPMPVPVIAGPDSVCAWKETIHTTTRQAAMTWQWSVLGGSVIGSANDTALKVRWNGAGAGSVTLTQTNAFGCDSTVMKNIVVRPTPAPQIIGPDSVCAFKAATYRTPGSTGSTWAWTVTRGAISGSASDSLVTIIWDSAGTGSLSVREVNASGCDSVAGKSVLIEPSPMPVISGSDTVCAFHESIYTTNPGAGNSYQWTVTGGAIVGAANDTIVKIAWGATGSGSVSMRQITPDGCDSLVSLAVRIDPSPVPLLSGPDTVCAFSHAFYGTSSAGGNTWRWSVSGGSIVGAQTSTVLHVAWGANGTGFVELWQANAFGCDSTVRLPVRIQPSPGTLLNGPDTVCAFRQTVYSTNASAGNSYQWTVTGGVFVGSSTDTLVRIAWDSASSGSVTVRQVNAFGCDSTVSMTVRILPAPEPAITGPDTVCERKQDLFKTVKNAGHSYQWSATGATILSGSTDTAALIRWANAGTFTVTLKETNAQGCDSIISHQVFVKPTPLPLLTGNGTVCRYRRGSYDVLRVPGDQFAWDVSGGTIESIEADTHAVVMWTQADSGTVSVRQTNPQGCDSVAVMKVLIRPTPLPVITSPDSACEYKFTIVRAQSMPGHTYHWSVAGGSGQSVNDSTFRILWGPTGTGTITLRIVSPAGCDSTVAKTIQILPTPVPDFSGSLEECAFTAAGYSIVPVSGHTYHWSVNGGTIVGPDNTASVTVLWGDAGTGAVALTQTSASGCDSTITKNVVVKARPVPKINGPGIACAGISQYTYSVTPSLPDHIYNWAVTSGNIVSGAGTPQVRINWQTKGSQVVTLHMVNAITGCDSTVTLPVVVDSIERPGLSAGNLAGCVPLSVTFLGNQPKPGYSYLWNFGDGHVSTQAQPQYVYVKPGVFNVQVRMQNANGCKDSASANIIVNFIPKAAFDYSYQNEVIYANEDNVFFKNKSVGGNRYLWSLGIGGIDSSSNPQTKYDRPGFFTVVLRTIDTTTGCEHTSIRELEVRVREELYVPNAFTPNGDGINDYFSVSITNIVDFRLIIFNRWGAIMFDTDETQFKWDGNYEGAPAQSDVYGWLVEGIGYHGRRFSKSGTVTLLR